MEYQFNKLQKKAIFVLYHFGIRCTIYKITTKTKLFFTYSEVVLFK